MSADARRPPRCAAPPRVPRPRVRRRRRPGRRGRTAAVVAVALGAIVGSSFTPDGPSSAAVADCPQPEAPDLTGVAWSTDFGEPQNVDCRLTTGGPFDFGELEEPPTATRAPDTGLDYVAHWYNDFGLDATLRQSTGWLGWYDWRWNLPSNTGDGITSVGYDPARQPLIGNYRGDDPKVLGWAAYWLAAGGVHAAVLWQQAGFTSAGWGGAHPDWVEQYLTATPNAAALPWALTLRSTAPVADIRSRASELVATYRDVPGAYEIDVDGARHAVVAVWDMEALRGELDRYQGTTHTDEFLVELADGMRSAGYDGVTVLARNGGLVARDAAPLRAQGVDVQFSSYEGTYAGPGGLPDSYEQYVDELDHSAVIPFDNTVVGVATSHDSAYPHPSRFRMPGSTPELFARQLRAASEYAVASGGRRMVTIGNVAEWAEQGPGLLPNVRDGFGYLEAVASMPDHPR